MSAAQGEVLDPSPSLARIRLTTARDLLREHRRLYAEARCGRLPLADACRLSYLLSNIAKLHEVAELEARVRALENADTPQPSRGA